MAKEISPENVLKALEELRAVKARYRQVRDLQSIWEAIEAAEALAVAAA
jgi:hypothetical protein